MKTTFFILLILIGYSSYSQDTIPVKRRGFARLDFSVPLRINKFYGSDEPHPDSDRAFIIIDGAILRMGADIEMAPWIHLVGLTGFDWKSSYGMIGTPFIGAIKFCPKIGSDTALMLEPGFGKFFDFSKYHRSGYIGKITLGVIESATGQGLFIEFGQYGSDRDRFSKVNNFSMGFIFNLNSKSP